jgi:hypothetical protein
VRLLLPCRTALAAAPAAMVLVLPLPGADAAARSCRMSMMVGLNTVTEPAASSSSTITGAFQSSPSSESCTRAAAVLVELESGAAVYGRIPR